MPILSIHNRQRQVRFNLHWLRRFGQLALPACLEESGDGQFALKKLPEVEVAIVSDRVIARVHEEFMAIAGPTDVITFEHGEIVISGETARDYGEQYGHTLEQELALYTIHGMLHLNGFEDGTAREAARMAKIQARILRNCLKLLPAP